MLKHYIVYIQAMLLFGILHFLAYLFSFQSTIDKTAQLQQEITVSKQAILKLKQERDREKNKPAAISVVAVDSTFRPIQIEGLFMFIQQSGLKLVSMTDQGRGKSPVTKIDHARIVLEGSYAQFADFLLHLSNALHVGLVTNVIIKAVNEDKCVFTLDIMLWQGVAMSERRVAKLNLANNPMCASAEDLMEESVDVVLAATPRAQLKIMGSYQRGAKKWVIVMLPDARLIDLPAEMLKAKGGDHE